jgi:Glycosyl transferases group 1
MRAGARTPRRSRPAARLRRVKRLGRWSTLRALARELGWRLRGRRALRPTSEPSPSWIRHQPTVRVTWPPNYRWPPASAWLEPIRLGLEPLVELRRAPLAYEPVRHVVPFEIEISGRRHAVAIDYGDDVALDPRLLRDYALVFKMQYLLDGYGSEQVVPGGFVPNGMALYRFLPHLRRLRDSGRRTSDAYGRFGDDKNVPIRQRAVGLLDSQQSFRYLGGFGRVRYSGSLVDAACARTCVDLPGLGPLCFRLVDYLAIGVPIVSPPHICRLHVPLEDGVHLRYCRADLSDLVETIEEVLAEPAQADRLAREARNFFDQHLHYQRLAGHYLTTCLARL